MNSRKVKRESVGDVVHIRLCGKIKGQFATCDAMGRGLSVGCWEGVVSSQLPRLAANPVKVLKSDGNNKVIMGRLDLGGVETSVVVKIYGGRKGFVGRLRKIFRCKASRNFAASVRLLELGIGVAFPLAAIRGGHDNWMRGGVFVSGYVDGAVNLYDFVRDNISLNGSGGRDDFRLKRHLAGEIGRIFAMVDTAGLWHRDAKASNFLVCLQRGKVAESAAGFDVILVDLDGIKRKLVNSCEPGFRGLAKLASTLIWHGGISTSDYFRAFTVYCNLTGLDKSRRREVFRELTRRAVALRLLTLARTVINQKSKIKNQPR